MSNYTDSIMYQADVPVIKAILLVRLSYTRSIHPLAPGTPRSRHFDSYLVTKVQARLLRPMQRIESSIQGVCNRCMYFYVQDAMKSAS